VKKITGAIYLGFGSSTSSPRFRAAPTGEVWLPAEAPRIYEELMKAFEKNAFSGDGHVLIQKLADLRTLAARHEAILDPSADRIGVLVDAASDPNSTVRHNAARGLIE